MSAYYYVYVCPHTAAIYVSSYYYVKVEADDLLLTGVAICVLILLYTCVSSYCCYICVLLLLCTGGDGRPLVNRRCRVDVHRMAPTAPGEPEQSLNRALTEP